MSLLLKMGVLVIVLAGCSQKQAVVIQTKEVFIPIACDLPLPPKPKQTFNVVADVVHLTLYAKALESTLRACKGERE